ncbi:TfoX/Sxy family protein [Uliginosibacterium sp. H3]|uniref:TfoX/Sxy family protein n=1 Tax=Uliginosibacterium silvisoli TaxID=3114758 RepID=A0ABU6K7A6_9RHOO|nr:TfoX/Sxy family protein [Uliginosibacterium sp. H3]
MHDEFADHLRELFAPLGAIQIKRMFGGAGIYAEDIMFALLADDVLYLKVDEQNRALFEAEGLEAFSYVAKGNRRVSLSYFRAPDEAMDSAQLMLPWARSAFAAALRASVRKTSSKAVRTNKR